MQNFDALSLVAAYNRGCLVPFIGAGMSSPTCALWPDFVVNLERQAKIDSNLSSSNEQRALSALQVLRKQGRNISSIIENAVYSLTDVSVPPQTDMLASIFWPLICTTNYDDVYFRAKLQLGRTFPQKIFGRSEADCREVLRHLHFPSGEAVWALQGLLLPAKDAKVQKEISSSLDFKQFEKELVVGHAEYRKVTHLAPHFRRCFAELFRNRSLLFLGSGLAEPYFLTLFDEIIELTGPPVRPHFAVIEEGKLDPEFLQREYHIICNVYPKAQHGYLAELLRDFGKFTNGDRVRPNAWGFRVSSPLRVGRLHSIPHFQVVYGGPPELKSEQNEVVAISCGRDRIGNPDSREAAERGKPLPGDTGKKILKLGDDRGYEWLDVWTIKWSGLDRAYGIVAREPIFDARTSRDRRSPDAVRKAFLAFLFQMDRRKVKLVHVQLLAAGKKKVFQPWISLAQMARAYGQWAKAKESSDELMRVNVYVVDPGVISLLQGGYLDLVQPLQDSPLYIIFETIDASGSISRHHCIVSAQKQICELVDAPQDEVQPRVHAYPIPTLKAEPKLLQEVKLQTLGEFGLVSGSTLVVDYSKPSQFVAGGAGDAAGAGHGFLDTIKQDFQAVVARIASSLRSSQ